MHFVPIFKYWQMNVQLRNKLLTYFLTYEVRTYQVQSCSFPKILSKLPPGSMLINTVSPCHFSGPSISWEQRSSPSKVCSCYVLQNICHWKHRDYWNHISKVPPYCIPYSVGLHRSLRGNWIWSVCYHSEKLWFDTKTVSQKMLSYLASMKCFVLIEASVPFLVLF